MTRTRIALLTTTLLAWGLATAPAFANPPGPMGAQFGRMGGGMAGPMGGGMGGPGCSYGGHGHGMHGDVDAGIDRMSGLLDLSKEQRDAMRAIGDKHRPQLRELGDRLSDSRRQLRELAAKGTPDAAQVRPLAEAQGKAMADMMVLRTQMRAEMDKVLTDAQRDKLRQMRERRGPGRGIPGAGPGPGPAAGSALAPAQFSAMITAHRLASGNIAGASLHRPMDEYHL
ncbi:MAG: Spy/CpxP family protein refolding chaperone [Betaproteobacteria bacterium]|nr:Spy/CpxP family protein refolding chaperone [Betaproteobacteria bacterium]